MAIKNDGKWDMGQLALIKKDIIGKIISKDDNLILWLSYI